MITPRTIVVLNLRARIPSTTTTSPSSVIVPATKDVYASDDQCMWYQNSTLCQTPRSCYDCLNTALYSGQKCTITPGGYCTTIDAYDYTLDYRRVYSDNAAHYFPSTNTTYCEYGDPTCTACREYTFTGAYSGHENLTEYCVGTNDCVCVAFCESPNWTAIVTDEACEATPVVSTGGSNIPSIGIASIIVVAVVLSLSAGLQLFNMFRARRKEITLLVFFDGGASTQRTSTRRPPTTGLVLELSAWKEMRNGIIDEEREFAGEGVMVPRLADATDDVPVIMVEDGDGYRPLSPGVPQTDSDPKEAFATRDRPTHLSKSRGDFTMASSSSSASAVGETITTPAPTASPAKDTRASDNLCMWTQQESDACDSPRSCYDCLNTSPGDGVDCVITSAGYCTTIDAYVWQEDYRLNTSDSAPHYFPSTNTTYCESSDATCQTCESDQFIKAASGTTDPSQYCVGSNGCVCVGYCESPVYSSLIGRDYCESSGSSTPVSVLGISVSDIIAIVILCFSIPVIIYLWMVRRLQRQREAREEVRRNRPPVNGPLLPLVGWKRHREDLMANETTIAGVATSGEVEPEPAPAPADSRNEDAVVVPSAPLITTLQVAPLSVEFEDPEHPLTAVTRTGRRRSSMENVNVARGRPSEQPSLSERASSNEEEGEETDVHVTPYAQLEDHEGPIRR
ncbi:hypothetical protein BBJ28_00008386 [Nothophytophthora sp. Chile5]|nr:hypothetical protein BBJ28_00008386 [Nothophytophthora sp. Chile5]